MGGALTRTWFMTTSPRNPAKIRQELELLSRFDGRNWWEKDQQGLRIHQLQFAQLLAESDFFEGTISSRYPDLSARDRLRAPQMLGFVYIANDVLHITPAGWQLIRGESIRDLFLRQMLKWQFPSWQHGGNPKTRWRYQKFLEGGVHPFRETLRVALELEGITKHEIALFLLPALTPQAFNRAVDKIREFRHELQSISGLRPRREFLQQVYESELQRIYAEDIRLGRIGIRETPAEGGRELQHFIHTKGRNLQDYADAVMRYFRYTGLFTLRGNRLVVSNVMKARQLLAVDLPLRTDYENVATFYEYLGNPSIPQLPWETPSELQARLEQLSSEIKNLSTALGRPTPQPPERPLLDLCHWMENQISSLRLELLRQRWDIEEVTRFYTDILRRRVPVPSLFMEWNTWRAFLRLNHYCSLRPNFSLDLE